MSHQPKTGAVCSCRPGRARDNCPTCEGTGMIVDHAAIRAQPLAPPAPAAVLVIYKAALTMLNACRQKCPGAGGDVDAMNLRHLITAKIIDLSASTQAARTLENLSHALEIDAESEVCALLEIATVNAADDLKEALRHARALVAARDVVLDRAALKMYDAALAKATNRHL